MNRDYQQTHFFDLLLNQTEAEEAPPPAPKDAIEPETELEKDIITAVPTVIEDLQGRLPPEARRALIALLRHGVIMAEGKRLLFEALCRYRAGIQEHLADMNLRLLLDEKPGIAMLLAQVSYDYDDEDDEGGSLISRRTLSLYDTLLLLVLRKHYQERETAGEQRVIIDNDRIDTALRPFLPLTNSSRSDQRQLNGAVNTMKERRILAAVRGEDDRYEITPVIRYVVNAAFLEQMLDEYTRLAERAGSETNNE